MADDKAVTEADLEEQTPDTELDDIEASFDDEDEPEEDDKATEEEDDSDDDYEPEDFEEDDSEDESDEEEPDSKEEDKSKDKPEDSKPELKLSEEDQRKARNREQAEARIKAKAEREAGIQQQQDAYVAEADPDDPQDVALRQLQVEAYNHKVEVNTDKLTTGYEKAVKDFPILADSAPEIRKFVDDAIDAYQAINVRVDRYGNPVDVKGDFYSYLQDKADSIAALTGRGARKQTDAKGKQRSKALAPPSRAPKQPKSDPDMDGFDEEAARY